MVRSPVWTHSDVGGWKWMPLGAGSQVLASPSDWLGRCPYARAKARLNPSTDS